MQRADKEIMMDELGTLFRVLLERLKGKRLIDITADGSNVVCMFENGDTITFGRFLYTPILECQEQVSKDLREYLNSKADIFKVVVDEDNDDNDNQCDEPAR